MTLFETEAPITGLPSHRTASEVVVRTPAPNKRTGTFVSVVVVADAVAATVESDLAALDAALSVAYPVHEIVLVLPGSRGRLGWARDLAERQANLQVLGLLQPLGVLDRLRRAHHGERLVRREHPVPTGERVALQPPVAVVLREHLHHPAVARDPLVGVGDPLGEGPVGDLQDGAEPVESPLTFLLCPSVLAKTLKSRPAKVDRAVLAQVVRKMGAGVK